MANQDRINEVYFGSHGNAETQRRTRARLAWTCAQVQGERVLDLGCSQGIVSILLAREGHDVIGVDVEEPQIGVARAAAEQEPEEVQQRLEFRHANGADLEFADGTFDAVVTGEVIEHLEEPGAVLSEARRVLKPSGRFVLTVPLGYMPHDDHKRSYALASLVETVAPYFHCEQVDVLGESYVAFVGRPRHGDDAGETADPWEMLALSEEAFLAREEREHDRVRRFKARAQKLEERCAELTRQRDSLATRLREKRPAADLLDAARRQVGRLKDGRSLLRSLKKRVDRQLPAPLSRSKRQQSFHEELVAWTERIAAEDPERVAWICAEAGLASGQWGRRGVSLVRALRARGVPVLFGYWRWRTAGPLPSQNDPGLLFAPLDLLSAEVDGIAACAGAKKMFLCTFPFQPFVRWADKLNARGWVPVYDCQMEWNDLADEGLARWWQPGVEEALANESLVVTATSPVLRARMAPMVSGRTVQLLPNALPDEFVSPHNLGRLAPRDGAPVVGYWGDLSDPWIDWPALAELAALEPDWRFEIVGQPAPRMAMPENVVYLGRRSAEHINNLCQAWRAALLPFKVGGLSAALDPPPVYQFLAMGLPTVTPPAPSAPDAPYVYRAASVEEMRARLSEAMSVPMDREVIDRFVADHRWDCRIDSLLGWVDDPLGTSAAFSGRTRRSPADGASAAPAVTGPMRSLAPATEVEPRRRWGGVRVLKDKLRATPGVVQLADARRSVRFQNDELRRRLAGRGYRMTGVPSDFVRDLLWGAPDYLEVSRLLRMRGPAGCLAKIEAVAERDPEQADLLRLWYFVRTRRDAPLEALPHGEAAYRRLADSRVLGWSLADTYRQLGEISRPAAMMVRYLPTSHALPILRDSERLLAHGFQMPPAAARAEDVDAGKVIMALHMSPPHHTPGYSVRSHGVLSQLARFGWNVEAVTRLGYPSGMVEPTVFQRVEQAGASEVDGITYRHLLDDKRRLASYPLSEYIGLYARALVDVAREQRAALIHGVSNHVNGLAAVAAARQLGVPSIYEVRGLWEVTRASREPWFDGSEQYRMQVALEMQAARDADAVIAITEGLKNELATRGVERDKIVVVPNAVDIERFEPAPRDVELEGQLGLRGKRVIGYVGSIVNYEGLDLLVEAARLLRDRGRDDFRVMIVGSGAFEGEVRALVDNYDLGEVVLFTGRVPFSEVERYYSLIDITPFPRKGFKVCEIVSPLKPFETMAMEKAAVVSNVAALAEIVTDNETGLVHTKDDAADLARCLTMLLDDRALCERLGENARRWVERERTWERTIRGTAELYERLIGSAPA